ncbi:hypothetical protein [Sporichthya polymorpha]|uniref:hypothetical protein n=1 Tax=Sporichthya polymorpha TaxID=35751 RepID=UPI00037461A8|nr:hypothetical protein [Sporichthya polymorpha]
MTTSNDADLLLAVLVQASNSSADPETSVSITLTVGGLVVSGDLVPAWVWLREVRGLLVEGSGTGADGMANVFGMLADDALGDALIRDATGSLEDEEAPAQALPTTIHLARAVVLGAHHHQELAGGLWRGRLSHVTGWTFGRFEP